MERDKKLIVILPSDEEVESWFSLNISEGCSASSGIYKFRLWLRDIAEQSRITEQSSVVDKKTAEVFLKSKAIFSWSDIEVYAPLFEEYYQFKQRTLESSVVVKPDLIEEILAKYWYETIYVNILKSDHSKAEESRQEFKKWIDDNKHHFTPSVVYPEEFVEWLSFGNHPLVQWRHDGEDYFTDEVSDKKWSISDLYEYWQLNIKDK